jgi:flagellar motor switch/type III secretory pathway protein FliN
VVGEAEHPDRLRTVAPFPWVTLDRVTREEVETLAGARRWAATKLRIDQAAEVLGGLVGARVELLVRGAVQCVGQGGGAPANDREFGVLLAPAHRDSSAAPMADGVLVELEAALAGALVARALRRPAPVLVKPGVVSEGVAGAAAALVAAVARRVHARVALTVHAAGPAAALRAALCAASPDVVAVTWTVLVGDEAYAARAVVPRRALTLAPPESGHAWGANALAALGATPLRISIVAWAVELTTAEIATLGPGDVLVVERGSLTVDASTRSLALPRAHRVEGASATLVGPVWLAAASSDVGVRADLVEGPRLVLRGEREPLGAAEATMTEAGEERALVEAIGDVPVLVRVEVGEAVMSARQWASLAPGDVVGLGRRLGEHVVLRIGGVPVARGELVDIEGEMGVRIVARLAEETTVA